MEVLRYVLPHLLVGSLGGIMAAGGIVATNQPLRELMLHSPDGWLAAALLAFGFSGTFGSAAVGAAIMRIGQEDR